MAETAAVLWREGEEEPLAALFPVLGLAANLVELVGGM